MSPAHSTELVFCYTEWHDKKHGKDRQLIYDDESGNWTFRFRCDNMIEFDTEYDFTVDEREGL